MTVRFYTSSDASAPSLSGTAGALVTVLDAILVNGYGSRTAAGWTKAFTGTNKAAYRMGTTGNTGFYLNVDDSGGGAGGARETFLTGYQTMSALATGTGQFPTSAQLNQGTAPAGSLVCRKSNTADATARTWYCLADASVFYLLVETGDLTSPTQCFTVGFGDIYSQNGTSDLYRCCIWGRASTNSSIGNCEFWPTLQTDLASVSTGHLIAAQPNGVGTSVYTGQHVDYVKFGASGVTQSTTTGLSTGMSNTLSIATGGRATGPMAYPNTTDGALYMSPVWVHHNNTLRGRIKGIWAPCQFNVLNHGDTFTGTGDQAGKSFICLNLPATGGTPSYGTVYLETSDTWS